MDGLKRKTVVNKAVIAGKPFHHKHSTLAQYLQSIEHSDAEYIFITTCNQPRVYNNRELFLRARKILRILRKNNVQKGDVVLAVLAAPVDYLVVFWACALGGITIAMAPQAHEVFHENKMRTLLWKQQQTLNCPICTNLSQQNLQRLFASKIAYIDISCEDVVPDTTDYGVLPQDKLLLISSSGTTGTSKFIVHTQQSLALPLADKAQIDQRSACYWHPLTSISGMRMLLPDCLRKIYLPAALIMENPLTVFDWVDHYRIRIVVTSNFLLRRTINFLRNSTEQKWDLSCVKVFAVSGEKIELRTLQEFYELVQQYGVDYKSIVPAYGMSELPTISSHIFSSPQELCGEIAPCGKAATGVSIRVVDDKGKVVDEEQTGHIEVYSDAAMLNYHDDSAPFTKDGWLQTGDDGFIRGGNLFLTGRSKDIVILNAQNYFYSEIEYFVEQIKGVSPSSAIVCCVRLQNSDTDDLLVFAHTSQPPDQQKQLRYSIAEQLAKSFGHAPQCVIFIEPESVPRTQTGKVQRHVLVEKFHNGAFGNVVSIVNKTPYIAASSELQRKICAIWQEVLSQEQVGIDNDFFALGGTSLHALSVISKMRKLFGVNEHQLPLSILLTHPTVFKLSQVIKRKNYYEKSAVIQLNTQTRTPVFVVHVAGVDPICYQYLASALDNIATVYAIRTDELQDDISIEETAKYHIQKIKTIAKHGPYIIGGMCIGGLVAFEVSRQLREEHEEIKLTFLMDTINIPGMENYKSKQQHILGKSKLRSVKSTLEFVTHLLKGDFDFVVRKVRKLIANIKSHKQKKSDITTALRKKMRNKLRVIRDKYTPQFYEGRVVYIRSEKKKGDYAQRRLQELAQQVKTHQIEGTVHSDVTRLYFSQQTAQIIQSYI